MGRLSASVHLPASVYLLAAEMGERVVPSCDMGSSSEASLRLQRDRLEAVLSQKQRHTHIIVGSRPFFFF